MISSGTFHVVATELTIGNFALCGMAFLCLFFRKGGSSADAVAHWSMLAGLVFTPFAVISGVLASTNGGLSSELLANKTLLSFTAVGLASGVLWNRWKHKGPIIERTHAVFGMISTGMILLTASIGGYYSRGESLIPFIPKDVVPLFPIWASSILLVMGLVMVTKSTVEH